MDLFIILGISFLVLAQYFVTKGKSNLVLKAMEEKMKFKDWKDTNIQSPVVVSRKIDGVRVEYKNGEPFSRSGKQLYNLPKGLEGIYESYLGSFKKTIQRVRSQKKLQEVRIDQLYRLDILDDRLFIESRKEICKICINMLAQKEWHRGNEGLILNDGNIRWKVKQKHTIDVPILEIIPGKGRHEGRMGALLTPQGKVGTGFTDKDREEITEKYIGKFIECEYMELTENGKMRMPRFKRLRLDK